MLGLKIYGGIVCHAWTSAAQKLIVHTITTAMLMMILNFTIEIFAVLGICLSMKYM